FFFQAEDGIRDRNVTGVQTCALPISSALTDTDVKYLLLYFEQNYGLTSEKKLMAALSIVANENYYHPIQDVLNSLEWDGKSRIRSEERRVGKEWRAWW